MFGAMLEYWPLMRVQIIKIIVHRLKDLAAQAVFTCDLRMHLIDGYRKKSRKRDIALAPIISNWSDLCSKSKSAGFLLCFLGT